MLKMRVGASFLQKGVEKTTAQFLYFVTSFFVSQIMVKNGEKCKSKYLVTESIETSSQTKKKWVIIRKH